MTAKDDAIGSQSRQEPLISVIIPVHADAESLEQLLGDLRAQTLPQSRFEIIVVNDGGSRAVECVCETLGVAHIPVEPRQGTGYAREVACRRARADQLAFVDCDVTLPTAWLEQGWRLLSAYHYVAGAVRVADRRGESLWTQFLQQREFPVARFMAREGFGVTANLFVSRQVLHELGGFECRLESGADALLGRQVHAHGAFRTCYAPELEVVHPPRSLAAHLRKLVRVSRGTYLAKRWYPELMKPALKQERSSPGLRVIHGLRDHWRRCKNTDQFGSLLLYPAILAELVLVRALALWWRMRRAHRHDQRHAGAWGFVGRSRGRSALEVIPATHQGRGAPQPASG